MKNLPPRKKALFLYFELAGYFIACLDELANAFDVDIHLVRYPVASVAPFQFSFNKHITVHERNQLDRKGLIELTTSIQPDFVFICGWADKDYLAVARFLNKKIPVVMSLDNPWLGTLKQYLASIIGPGYLPKLFTHCWVPGEPNAVYARKLGFQNERLLTGMYSADTPLFGQYERAAREKKNTHFPHRFLFVGRFTPLKGIRELWEAFCSLTENERKDWELWCIGKGELASAFPSHPAIKDIGFVQPDQLAPYLESSGVFILPAHYEHWGVVVHEFAAAGFPLICSTKTSAATAFLKEEWNGYFTKPKDVDSIKSALLKTIQQSDDALRLMGRRSMELSAKISPQTWAETVWNLMTGSTVKKQMPKTS